jgi:hypothetical protein
MNYLPEDFSRCPGNPLLEQCKTCQRNVNNSPVHPKAERQMWIGPWVGHGPCPNGDFVEVKDE